MIRVVSNCFCEACDCSVVELGEVGCGMVNNLGCGMCYFCQFVRFVYRNFCSTLPESLFYMLLYFQKSQQMLIIKSELVIY